MKILLNNNVEIDATETNTSGKYKYLVATAVGGVMEDPDIRYVKYQIIMADSEQDAVVKYNTINRCSFYYGAVIQKLSDQPPSDAIKQICEDICRENKVCTCKEKDGHCASVVEIATRLANLGYRRP